MWSRRNTTNTDTGHTNKKKLINNQVESFGIAGHWFLPWGSSKSKQVLICVPHAVVCGAN